MMVLLYPRGGIAVFGDDFGWGIGPFLGVGGRALFGDGGRPVFGVGAHGLCGKNTSWGGSATGAIGGAGVCWDAGAGVVCGFGCWETVFKERESRKSYKKRVILGDWLFNLVVYGGDEFLIKMNKKFKKYYFHILVKNLDKLMDEVLKNGWIN